MTRKRRRLILLMTAMGMLAVAAALVMSAFRDNLVFFLAPSEVVARELVPEQRIRIGGLVENGSVQEMGGHEVRFRVTDGAASLTVAYDGMLPDLFREGQGVVAEGHVGTDGIFRAAEVLAKHDENYMPPEVAEALKRGGVWQHDGDGPKPAPGTLAPASGTAGDSI